MTMSQKTIRRIRVRAKRSQTCIGEFNYYGEAISRNWAEVQVRKRILAELLIDPSFYTKAERLEHLEVVRHA